MGRAQQHRDRERTHLLLGNLFEYRDLGEVQAKGLADPMPVGVGSCPVRIHHHRRALADAEEPA
jgi:hypothetical protein